MTIAKSLPQNVKIVDGNSVQVYVDEPSGILYLKDIYGRVEPLSNYLTPSNQILVNVGNGSKVYTENTGLPAQLRTLVQGTNITIVENPTEIQISSSAIGSLSNIGTGAQIYKSGNNPAELRTITQGTNVVVTQNANDIEISVPSITGITMYRGSFFSTQTQTTAGNVEELMTYNNSDISVGVSIVSNSQITIAQVGDYNIQFSAQIVKTQGGSSEDIYIYLKKNGNPVADSNTKLTLANNGTYLVAAWNFFVNANNGDNFEIAWYTTDQHIQLEYDPSPVVGIPEIPSVILTVNRVG